MKGIVLLAHGSPDLRSGIAMRQFAEKIQNAINMPITVAFLDHERPILVEISKELDAEDTIVVPMLLSNAFHARFDVPKALREAGLQRTLPPIGNPTEILRHLIENAGSDVVVVAAGSSDARARNAFKDAVRLASVAAKTYVEPAFVTGPELRIDSVLANTKNASQTKIVPWLLAQGRLLDVILSNAQRHGATVQGNGLVEEASFLEHLCASIQLSLQSESDLAPVKVL